MIKNIKHITVLEKKNLIYRWDKIIKIKFLVILTNNFYYEELTKNLFFEKQYIKKIIYFNNVITNSFVNSMQIFYLILQQGWDLYEILKIQV